MTTKTFKHTRFIGALLFGASLLSVQCAETSALQYNPSDKTTSSTATVDNGVATITVGVKLEESGEITSATWLSDAPNPNGTYDAGKIGTISVTYSANASGTIHFTQNSANLTSENGDSVGYAVGGSANKDNTYSLAVGASTEPAEVTADVEAKSAITTPGMYSDTVTISFIPAVAPSEDAAA